MIELDKYSRLQVHILHNEIRARLNDGNISSRKSNDCFAQSDRHFLVIFQVYYHLEVHSRIRCIWVVYPNLFIRK